MIDGLYILFFIIFFGLGVLYCLGWERI
jgi:hypothetical protein